MHEFLVEAQKGQPGYEGYLNNRVVTIATLMRDAGYRTSMAGKWHLGAGEGESSESLTFTANGKVVDRPVGIHSNELYADKIIGFLDSEQDSDQPFFAYLSTQTAHWPHQAPREFIDKYRDVYSAGWDVVRAQRVEKLKALGILSKDHPDSPRFPGVPA